MICLERKQVKEVSNQHTHTHTRKILNLSTFDPRYYFFIFFYSEFCLIYFSVGFWIFSEAYHLLKWLDMFFDWGLCLARTVHTTQNKKKNCAQKDCEWCQLGIFLATIHSIRRVIYYNKRAWKALEIEFHLLLTLILNSFEIIIFSQ